MRVDIVPIGNSRGIRIPRALLTQCGFGEAAEISVEDDRLVVSPAAPERRAGWDDAFQRMAEQGDDRLLETPPPEFDDGEWAW